MAAKKYVEVKKKGHMPLSALQKSVKAVNESKLVAGVIMLIMNIGSRYIQVKLTKTQEAFLRNYVVREILIFAVSWMATRDLYLSIVLTASFFVLTEHLFNEESTFCVLPHYYRNLQAHLDLDGDGEVSEREIADAIEVLKRAKEVRLAQDKEATYSYFTNAKNKNGTL